MFFKDLKRNLAKDYSQFSSRRLAVLGDTATQFLVTAIKGYGYEARINFEIFEAEFDQMDRQILDPESDLYRSEPEFIVLYLSAEKLWTKFAATDPLQRDTFATKTLSQIESWWETISRLCKATLIHFNLIETTDPVFGHFGGKSPFSFSYQIRKLNYELTTLVQTKKRIFIADIAGLSNHAGYANAHDPRLYATAKVAFALDFLPTVAKAVVDIVRAINGNIKKCLILDLDNTVWGGVIGDDGVENIEIGELGMGRAFDSLQRWAKELKNRGIILAVCSKNEEDIAKKPFRDHPDMILRMDDIAVFCANWDNKVDNIKRVQETLNIGFDSMVFLDDNQFERNLVRELLPLVTVPELPEDPALYAPYVSSLNLFEMASFSDEDLRRTQQYQEEAARVDFQKAFTSIDDYLKSLEMVSEVKPFDDFSIPRVAQLTQRSNQFNLRTIRYTEADIENIRKSKDFVAISFHLTDKFGDHGLVGLVILKIHDDSKAFIDTWIMSCRVLKRGMEEFIVNQMALQAQKYGIKRLVGEYIPSPKNKMVKDLYSQIGFAPNNGTWQMDLQQFKQLKTFIRENHL